MSRYSTFKYGSAKYGITTENRLSWGLDIDWDNDGYFSGENEAYYMQRLKVVRGRKNSLKSSGNGLEPIPPGEFQATLLNTSGRYDPYNSSSPLYPNVMPGCAFRLRVNDDLTGTVYPIMTGRLTDIRPLDERSNKVTIKGIDDLQSFKDNAVMTAIYSNIDFDTAAGYVLDQAGWSSVNRDIASSIETIGVWYARGKSAYEELNDLAEATLGRFFMSADGLATFHTRHVSPVPSYTLSESDIQRGIAVPQPWDVVRNHIQANINTRTAQATSELWRLQDKPSVAVGASITFWATYTYNNFPCAAQNVVTPVATTDYTMNTNSGGTGTNLTASFTVTATKYGDRTKLVVTNNSANVGYITLLKLRGDPLTVPSVTQMTADDTGSIAIYKTRSFLLDNPWLQSSNTGKDLVGFLRDSMADAKAFPAVRVKDNPSKQFSVDLFDRITLSFTSKGISGDYFVSYIEHEWVVPTGQTIQTIFRFEPTVSISGYWTFPTNIGTTSVFSF